MMITSNCFNIKSHNFWEVETLTNQSINNQQEKQMYSFSQKVEALINQSTANRQLLLDIFSKGLYVPPHIYIYQLTPGVQSWQESRQYSRFRLIGPPFNRVSRLIGPNC